MYKNAQRLKGKISSSRRLQTA